MSNRRAVWLRTCLSAAFIIAVCSSLSSAATADRISSALSTGETVALRGYVHHQARPQFDRGPVDPALRFGSIRLQTVPTPSQQKELTRLLADQQDRKSPNYHKWLTPEQWADRFGLSRSDVNKLTAWLKAQGFRVTYVARSRSWIMFSGTASQVQSAFGTEIHRFNVNGEMHVANATSPKIPRALAGVVTGIRGLDDFSTKPKSPRIIPDYVGPTFPQTGFTPLIAPGDIATMYDLNALYSAGIDGTGEKMAVIGQTDVYLDDLVDFRTAFALSPINSANCTVDPSGIITACNDPLFQYVLVLGGGTDPVTPASHADLVKADAAIEWAGAVAKNAQIIYVNAPVNVTGGTGGGWDVAWQYAVDNNLAPVISLSYGNCEFFYPSTTAAEVVLQQANMQGITFVAASGDEGPAECDFQTNSDPNNRALNGIAVTFPASSPEVTAVGGTSISVTDLTTNASIYWGATSGADGGSLLSPPPPEIAWNDDAEWAAFCNGGSPTPYCTNNTITDALSAQTVANIGMLASGGGVSNCANQTAGACALGFPLPAYQTALSGQPTARYVPDVALLASWRFPGFILCTNAAALGDTGTVSVCANGVPAALALSSPPIVGGTPVSTSVFAGMVVLLNQYLAGHSSPGLGNINPMLYRMAAKASNNYFHRVVSLGTNYVYCAIGTPSGQPPAYQCPGSGIIGFDSATSDATTGYNLVTGLGSVDLNNLAVAWDARRIKTTLALVPSAAQIKLGQSVTLTATVSGATTPLGNVDFFDGTTVIGTASLSGISNGVGTFSTTTLPGGANSITANYNGDSLNKSSTSTAVTVTVLGPDFSLAPNPTTASVAAGHTTSVITMTVTPLGSFASTVTFSCPAPPTPTVVACAFNPASVTPSGGPVTTSLTISTPPDMAAGTSSVTVSATGGSQTHTSTVPLTVSQTDQTFTLAPTAASFTVTQGSSVTATLSLTGKQGFNTALTYTCSVPAAATGAKCVGPAQATAMTAVSFQITTAAPSFALNRPVDRGSRIFYAVLLPGLLGILFTVGSRKRSLHGMRMLGLIMVLGVSTMWLGSCGGSNNASTKTGGTPKGAYSVTVNATTGGAVPVTGTTTIPLTVQ